MILRCGLSDFGFVALHKTTESPVYSPSQNATRSRLRDCEMNKDGSRLRKGAGLDTTSIPNALTVEQRYNWNTRLRGFKHSPIVGITENLLPKTAERGERDFYFFSLLHPLRTDFYLMVPAY
jgi:hypothetical protein